MWSFFSLLLVVYLRYFAAAQTAPTPTVEPTRSPTLNCPTGYSSLSISGYSSICLKMASMSGKTQQESNSLCSTSHSGGSLVQISNTATRDAILNYVASGSWGGNRDIWVGVQLSSTTTVSAKTAYSPYGSAQTSANEVTSVFTPYQTTTLWSSSSEPSGGDTAVYIDYNSGSSSAKFKGKSSSDNVDYGLW